MPKKLHAKLARQATRRGLTGRAKDRYIYGTMARVERSKKSRRSIGKVHRRR